ncbi:MAG TPA: exonuclease SbcCD subunit D [Acidimicrobiales bacterium]
MRLLHTSDWHLGRSLHGQSQLEAQAAFVEFLASVVRAEGIGAVVVCGDLYDRAIPPTEAVELFDEALGRLAALQVPVVIISGNHDSPSRLGFGADLIAASGVHLRTDPTGAGHPVVVADEHGDVAIYPLPYLEPELTWAALAATAPRHEAVLVAAMQAVRADAARRPASTRVVTMAHAFVAGARLAEASDSERDISVGGSPLVSASVFDGVHYAALGHLHRAQQPVAGRVTYSGSPVAYSFSEANDTKSVSIVDLGARGVSGIELLPCPVSRPLARLDGSLESFLTDPRWSRYEGHWLAVTLTDAEAPRDPMDRLRQRFPGVLQLTLTARRGTAPGSYVERLAGLDDVGVLSRFVEDMWQRPPSAAELDLLRGGLEAERVREVSA